MIPENIQNIIFDLGGVIINIDYQKTIDAFKKLSAEGDTIEFNQKAQSELFDDYETGKISDETFRDGLRRLYNIEASDEQIDEAWNALLLDIPQERVELLRELGKNHKLFLLSNTNAIHLLSFNQTVLDNFQLPCLDPLFDKCYYSHLAGQRKPDTAIFERILTENNLKKEETLFIDDSIQHIEAAKKVGLQTIHLTPPLTINQVLADVY